MAEGASRPVRMLKKKISKISDARDRFISSYIDITICYIIMETKLFIDVYWTLNSTTYTVPLFELIWARAQLIFTGMLLYSLLKRNSAWLIRLIYIIPVIIAFLYIPITANLIQTIQLAGSLEFDNYLPYKSIEVTFFWLLFLCVTFVVQCNFFLKGMQFRKELMCTPAEQSLFDLMGYTFNPDNCL